MNIERRLEETEARLEVLETELRRQLKACDSKVAASIMVDALRCMQDARWTVMGLQVDLEPGMTFESGTAMRAYLESNEHEDQKL